MNKIYLALLVLVISSIGKAEYTIGSLVCENWGNGVSCVSKASIAKDEAQLKLIKIQTELAQRELDRVKAQEELTLKKKSSKK